MHTFSIDTNINTGAPTSTSIPNSTTITPPDGPISTSNMEEGRSSNINERFKNKDSNVTMGIIGEPITSLFSSISSDQETSNTEEDELIEFAELEFDPEDHNVDDNAIKSEIELLLKFQESRMENLIDNDVTSLEDRLADEASSFKHQVQELQNVSHESEILFEQMKNIDVLLGATKTLVEDVCALNKDYAKGVNSKKESDGKVFINIESSLTRSCFKTELALILDLVLRLPTNAPCPSMIVSRGGDKCGSSKNGAEDKSKVVGKVFSTKISIPVSKKPIITTLKTIATSNVEIDMSKLQSKKWLDLNEGGLDSSNVKTVESSKPKWKGKGVQVEPTKEDKKKLQELEMKKMKQLNNIMRMRANDPPGLNKGDANKIVKFLSITPDVVFKGALQNYRFIVVRANIVLFNFTIDDFLLMNLNHLNTVMKMMGYMNNEKVQYKVEHHWV
ncbi:unnamed protein product [Lactuca saligna]|uniref:Uncharacterized protein n=1 Tax=Lactuca saligna TaxID=75948 RepID=A0AA36EF19_LACSI|nr:unnamed protein product [Lactuca saligna]